MFLFINCYFSLFLSSLYNLQSVVSIYCHTLLGVFRVYTVLGKMVPFMPMVEHHLALRCFQVQVKLMGLNRE